jgi:SOS-response transcriptional repressor LexA
LIVDNTIIPANGCCILCILNGRYAVRRLVFPENKAFLTSIQDETQIEYKIKDLEILGVIINILHIHQNLKKYFENHFL